MGPTREDRTRRRGRGEGSVFRKGDGLWVARGPRAAGGPAPPEATGRTPTEARANLRKLRDARAAPPAATEADRVPLGDRLAWWFEDVLRPTLALSTAARCEGLVRLHLGPALGGLTLGGARAGHLEDAFAALAKSGVRGSSARQCWNLLSGCLKHAVRRGLIARNPLADLPRPAGPPPSVEVFTAEQVRAILGAAREGKYRALCRYGALYALALGTGMRRGELLALSWPDVDPAAGLLRVERSLTWDGANRPVLKPPKSRRGRRSLSLPAFARVALEGHRERMGLEGHLGDPVFCSRRGNHLDRSVLRQSWMGLLRRAGVPRRGMHCARHTHASELLSRGVPLTEVARRLGDRPETVLAVYAHHLPAAVDVCGLLDAAYGAPGSPP